MQYVDSGQSVFAGECVDDDFGHRGAVGIVEKRSATECRSIIVDFRSAIKTGCRQRHAGKPGKMHELGEWNCIFACADVVFENIGDPTTWPGAFSSLASGGRLVTAGAHGGGLVTLDVRLLYPRRLQIMSGLGDDRRDPR